MTASTSPAAPVATPAATPVTAPPATGTTETTATAAVTPVARLTNSITSIPKATYVPLNVTAADTGGAVQKFGFVSSLDLQPGEVDAIRTALAVVKSAQPTQDTVYALVKQFEGSPLPSQLPSPAAFATIPKADLAAFGNALVATRQQAVATSQPAVLAAVSGPIPAVTAATPQANGALNRLNTAIINTNTFSSTVASPIGMLNLERMEMTPAGIERGGLIATIPLAPKERTCVVQQEWSVVSQEFTSIVTDSLENYSETGVTDTTQLTQSTQSQVAHANQFNINASVSGSISFVTGSVASSFGSQDQNSQSAADSRSHAIQTTRKASSRSIQSHKTSISISSSSGTSEASTRMLENPSATDPMRIDYFSLMRKWYVAVYRYGLRLTYDITIPEPGAAMREAYVQLAKLQAQAAQAFAFNLKYSEITLDNYQQLATHYGAQVPAPPQGTLLPNVKGKLTPTIVKTIGGSPVTGINTGESGWYTIWPLQCTVDDGYQIDKVLLSAFIGDNDSTHDKGYNLSIVGYPVPASQAQYFQPPYGQNAINNLLLTGFMAGFTGSVTITSVINMANPAVFTYDIYTVPATATMEQWQAAVYGALYNAAQTTYYTEQQNINSQITALQNQINNVDTLTLRREENDEIMKCAIRWILGKNFEFMPQNVINLFKQQSGADITHGVDFTGPDTNLSTADWTVVRQHEDTINFINQAIDWDNVLYFLYSYFWDVPQSWDFIRQIQHPDATRQAFLRAGSARIVLTVRKGWERAWTYFAEYYQTTLPSQMPSNPYLTIAQQIEDYDATNYPGIPPANPNGGGPVDDDTPQIGTTCDEDLTPSTATVTIAVADSTGFVTGATAIIDTFESGVQETQTITAVPDGTHITVQALSNAHSIEQNQNLPYPIVQAGEKGLLIAEWFEYTPSSGVDIAVNSSLPTIT